MKSSRKIAVGIVATLGLSLAVAGAYAHPGQWGEGMGPGGMAGMHQGMGRGMGPGAMGGQAGGAAAGQSLMTPEEQTAQREKMRNAATAEERQKLAVENHAEMQKRAAEKGITLPEPRGPHAGFGRNFAPNPAPAAK